MDHTLFKTQQLSGYCEWPDGRKGYLFYVANHQDYSGAGKGCIAFINGNSLEWDKFECVDRHQAIVGGFWAFLILQGCLKLEQRNQIEELWQIYCDYQENPDDDCFSEKREIHEMRLLESETENWIIFPIEKADIAIQQLYPDATAADFEQLVAFFLFSKMQQYAQDTYRLMWELQPYLYFPKDHRIAIYDRTDPVFSVWLLDFSESPDSEIVGFPARLLNYMVSHFVCQEGMKMRNADKLAYWIQKCFAFIDCHTRGAVLLEWIDFDFDGMNIKDIYEVYIEECRKYCTVKLLRDPDFAYALPQEQEYRIIHEIVKDECNTQKINNPILSYLTEKQRIAYEGLIYSFVMTLLKKLEGSEKYEKSDADLVFESFADMIQRLLDAGYLVISQQSEHRLSSGINTELQESENTQKRNTPKQEMPTYCKYINREKLKEMNNYTLDEFEAMFAEATRGTAPELAGFLKKYAEIGVLDFGKDKKKKKKIYHNLLAHFKEMRKYTYENFVAAY